MKNYQKIGLVFFIVFLAQQIGFSQKKRKRVSEKEIKIENLTQIELIHGKHAYPVAFLRKFKRDSLQLYTTVNHQDESYTYIKNAVSLYDFDYIKITDKKERFKKSFLWGLGLGSIAYVVTQQRSKNPQGENIRGSSGIVEGIHIGLMGFGVGILVYNHVIHRELSISDQKKRIIKKLKSF